MKVNLRNWKSNLLAQVIATILLTNFNVAAASSQAFQIAPGSKAEVKGSILSREGDLVRVREKKSGAIVVVNITDDTKIERKKSKALFFRHADMDVTAMVPGLTIEAEGVGNSQGQLDAKKISFTPDEFAIEVAEEQQVQASQAAAQTAQSTANQGVVAAKLAQQSASQAGQQAQAAGALGLVDATAVAMVNQRVSDLDHYKVEAENDVFFDADSAVLKEEAKPALADLARTAKSLSGYMIEISGYAAHPPNKKIDYQKLSEERAAAVAHYFYEVQNIPMRRILMPIGYSTTHRLASNTDAEGRELNRRVDVKVLVNKGEGEGL
ncbi:MAG TPA: OmpA family protein [Candidatus Binatia bacterium]|nr:OmpA family protein [Candidatus Binatia bacterium]